MEKGTCAMKKFSLIILAFLLVFSCFVGCKDNSPTADCWEGEYKNGTIDMKHVYSADTTITLHIKNIVMNDEHPEQSEIEVEIVSSIDQTATLVAISRQSKDNIGSMEYIDLELAKEVPNIVKIPFYNFSQIPYFLLTLEVDHTYVEIKMFPQ